MIVDSLKTIPTAHYHKKEKWKRANIIMFEIAIGFVMQIIDLIKNLVGAFSGNEE